MFAAMFGLGCFVAIIGRVCWEIHTDAREQDARELEWMQHNRLVASERARHARALGQQH